jgi:hypothetical protein
LGERGEAVIELPQHAVGLQRAMWMCIYFCWPGAARWRELQRAMPSPKPNKHALFTTRRRGPGSDSWETLQDPILLPWFCLALVLVCPRVGVPLVREHLVMAAAQPGSNYAVRSSMAVPNQTIYVNNINEKVKKDGAMPDVFFDCRAISPPPKPKL